MEVRYLESNSSICFYSYSHPDYPVQYSSVSITINNHEMDTVHRRAVDQTLEYSSNCIFLSSDVCNNITGSCETLQVSGIASNAMGNSEKIMRKFLITGKGVEGKGNFNRHYVDHKGVEDFNYV